MRPLRIKASSYPVSSSNFQGLQEMTDTEIEQYYSATLLKDFSDKDFLLLSGDPKVIGLAIAVACDINNGKYKTLTWDRQEKMYYPTEFNIHERGEIDESNRL